MNDLLELGREFLSLESKILGKLNGKSTYSYDGLSNDEKLVFYELLKRFDVQMFGLLLRSNEMKEYANEYLTKYYLGGDDLNNKEKYQSNLSILLDDYFEIEGEKNFQKLILTIPHENRNHPELVKAIRFVYDLDDEDGLPSWMF